MIRTHAILCFLVWFNGLAIPVSITQLSSLVVILSDIFVFMLVLNLVSISMDVMESIFHWWNRGPINWRECFIVSGWFFISLCICFAAYHREYISTRPIKSSQTAVDSAKTLIQYHECWPERRPFASYYASMMILWLPHIHVVSPRQ